MHHWVLFFLIALFFYFRRNRRRPIDKAVADRKRSEALVEREVEISVAPELSQFRTIEEMAERFLPEARAARIRETIEAGIAEKITRQAGATAPATRRAVEAALETAVTQAFAEPARASVPRTAEAAPEYRATILAEAQRGAGHRRVKYLLDGDVPRRRRVDRVALVQRAARGRGLCSPR